MERIKAARSAIDASGEDVLLTARTECYLTGHPHPQKESCCASWPLPTRALTCCTLPDPRQPAADSGDRECSQSEAGERSRQREYRTEHDRR